jgi:hypothetical protein
MKGSSSFWLLSAVLLVLSPALTFAQTSAIEAKTPGELVSTYESLANGILALQSTEEDVIRSILATTYTHAKATLAAAKSKIGAGDPARAEVERLAALVSQLGNEGDAAVAAIRKRLLEGGHHHHAAAEQEGLYDPGFVIVTRKAKNVFLDAATEIGKLAASPRADALDAQWSKVRQQYDELMKMEPR